MCKIVGCCCTAQLSSALCDDLAGWDDEWVGGGVQEEEGYTYTFHCTAAEHNIVKQLYPSLRKKVMGIIFGISNNPNTELELYLCSRIIIILTSRLF